MNKTRSYRDSLLSALCVISWFVMVFRIFNSMTGDSAARALMLTLLVSIATGIIGGIVLLFFGLLKKRNLKYSFVYNLFGTLNILAGSLGMMLPVVLDRPAPYIITASLVIGILMYQTIYRRRKLIHRA